jgi:kumamolisin
LIAAVGWAASCDDHQGSGAIDRVAKTSADLNSSPHVSDFVLYAERSITLGASDNVSGGDVGVRLPAPSSFGTQLSVGSLTLVAGNHNLLSPSVTLALASAVGDVQTNALQNNGAVVGAQATFPAAAMPVLPLAPPPAGGGSNVTVPAFQIVSLAPGNYGTLSVTGTLLLSPGTYSFASATVADQGHVAANAGGAKLLIGGSLTVGQGATILPGLGFTSDQLSIAVSGSNGSGGTPVVSIGQNSVVSTLLSAPHGTLSLAKGVHATGAFAAFDIAVSDHVDVDFQIGFSPTATGQHGLQQLGGYFTPALAAAPVVGPLPPSTTVSLAIGMPLSDPNGLQTYIQQISDPTSSGYRQNLTLDTLTTSFGPSTTSYSALVAWAQSKNLTIGTQFSHRLLLTVSGTAAAVEQAFYVNLDSALRPDGSSFYKLDRDPSVDLSATTATLGRVAGLDNLFVPALAGGTQLGGTEYSSVDLRNAYVPTSGLTGAGQSVGILAHGGYNHSDVALFESKSGLPSDPSTCGASTPVSAPCLVDVMENGFTGPINGYSEEATANVDMVIAMAPRLHNVVVFEQDVSAGCTPGDTIVADMLAHKDIKQFTSTVTFCVGDDTSLLDMMAAARQTFVVPSGDHGGGTVQANSNAVAFNVWETAKVLNVGGTNLTMNGAGASWASEQAWFYSGGGVENFGSACTPGCTPGTTGCDATCMPSWQHDIATAANGASSTYRNDPDVAMPAQSVFIVYQGSSTGYCGTSVAAPLWTGLTALVNQQNAANGLPSAGFYTPALYDIGRNSATYASSFNDITSNSSTVVCSFSGMSLAAAPTYDLATGWGSPKAGLIDQLSCVQCSGTTATPASPPSSTCATLQTDANNCGSCGHACLSGV